MGKLGIPGLALTAGLLLGGCNCKAPETANGASLNQIVATQVEKIRNIIADLQKQEENEKGIDFFGNNDSREYIYDNLKRKQPK